MGKSNKRKTLPRLLSIVAPLRAVMGLAILFGTLGNLASIAIVTLGAVGISDRWIDPNRSLHSLFVGLFFLAALRACLRYMEQYANHYVAFKLLAHIRDQVFRSLRRLAPAKLETKAKGDLISLITGDIEQLEVFFAHTVSPVFIVLLVSLTVLWVQASFHPGYAMISLIGFLSFGVLIPVINSRRAKDVGHELRSQMGEMTAMMLETVRGYFELLQMDGQSERIEKVKHDSREIVQNQAKADQLECQTRIATDVAIYITVICSILLSSRLLTMEALRPKQVVIPMVLTMSSFGPLVALSALSNNLIHTFASAKRVLNLVDEHPNTPEIIGQKDVSIRNIEIEDLSFSYDEQIVLKNVNLRIKEHEILGIQGVSGSGKSTLLKLLMRFWRASDCKIMFDRDEINHINTNSLRNNQACVMQTTDLFKDSIYENIRIGNLKATQSMIEEVCKKASIHDFIMQLPKGYQTRIDERGSNFSGGERQRIGLARAFLHDAPLLMLDEPTANIDSLNEGYILKSIQEETKDKTVILVSHKESTLSFCDEIYSMEKGKIQ